MNPLTKTQLRLLGTIMSRGPLSRKQLSERLSLTKAAITFTTHECLELGILREIGTIKDTRVGRKEILLDLVPQAGHVLGLDIKPNQIRVTCLNLKTEIVINDVYDDLTQAITALRHYAAAFNNVIGLGISLRRFHSQQKEAFQDIIDHVETLGIPTHYMNNVAALALAYKTTEFNDKNFMLIKYGPGVGSAIMFNHKLINTEQDKASEIGHVIFDCDNQQTLESTIGYSALFGDVIDDDGIVDYFLAHPKTCQFVLERLALSIVNAHALLSLEKIIIAGQIFSNEAIYNAFKTQLYALNKTHHITLKRIDDYRDTNQKKAAWIPLYYTFLETLN